MSAEEIFKREFEPLDEEGRSLASTWATVIDIRLDIAAIRAVLVGAILTSEVDAERIKDFAVDNLAKFSSDIEEEVLPHKLREEILGKKIAAVIEEAMELAEKF